VPHSQVQYGVWLARGSETSLIPLALTIIVIHYEQAFGISRAPRKADFDTASALHRRRQALDRGVWLGYTRLHPPVRIDGARICGPVGEMVWDPRLSSNPNDI
jgi:hypothetical protein